MQQNLLPPIEARFSINLVENARSELLLLKRSPDAKLGAGLWAFPAGHIETGETPAACALRELEEEIGNSFTLETVGWLGPVRDSYFGGVFELYLYHRRWITGDIRLNHEHTDYAWVGREHYRAYRVMSGTDEDIRYFNIWPPNYLSQTGC